MVTGDRIEFISSPILGDGEDLVFRATLPPHGPGAPMHSHDAMTETFQVEIGALEILLDGASRLLGPGEQITLPPGTAHGFRNAIDRETIFVTTASPGIDLESFLRKIYGLANEGMAGATGMPRNPLALASILRRTDMHLSAIPKLLGRILIGAMSVIAKVGGIDRSLDRFVNADAVSKGSQS